MSTALQIQHVLAVLSPKLLDMDVSKINQKMLTAPQRKVSHLACVACTLSQLRSCFTCSILLALCLAFFLSHLLFMMRSKEFKTSRSFLMLIL